MKWYCRDCSKPYETWNIFVRSLGYAPMSLLCKKCAGLFDGFVNLSFLDVERQLKKFLDFMKFHFGIDYYLSQEDVMRKYFYRENSRYLEG